jgi:hypothetical protein
MFFEQKYINEEINALINEKNVNVISFATKSTRVLDIKAIAKFTSKTSYYIIEYNPILDTFTVSSDENRSYGLTNETSDFLNTIDSSATLIIDITNVDIRFLGILLYNLKKMNFCRVICLYITPNKYNKNKDYLSDSFEEENKFDLYNNMGIKRGINGYLVDNCENLREKNFILLGFEGDRANSLCGEADITPVPVVTLPAIKPGWQNYALVANRNILKKLTSRNSIEYISADSIVSIYNKMQDWKDTYCENFLRISPLGTKINALGVLLFILNNPKSYDILYDNPNETKINSSGVDKYFYYDITEFLNN